MTTSAPLKSTTGALVTTPGGALDPGGAPRHVAPIILSFDAANYTKWAIYMKASLGRAGLIGHVDGTVAAAPTDATWSAEDYTILNLLHAAIDEDVADMVLSRHRTACQLWLIVHELFSTNKANKAIYLDNDLCQLVQGASSITDYCHRQKQLADSLVDNDSPVSARALVLNTLRGLGPQFAAAAIVISMMEPLPSFLRTRSMLLMEEMQQANAASTAANTTLVAHARPLPPACTDTGCRGDSSTSSAGKPKNTYKPKNKNRGRQGGGTPRLVQPAPTGPWVCFSPDAGQWHAPSAPDILGLHPQA
jgi:hypothetical protein